MKKILTVYVIAVLLPLNVFSEEKKPAAAPASASNAIKTELSDTDIDNRIKHADESLKTKIEEINNDFNEMQSYKKKALGNRIDFEKKLTEDKKNRLKDLKQRDMKERKVLWNAFNYRQRRERQKFMWKENNNWKKEARRIQKTKSAKVKKEEGKKK